MAVTVDGNSRLFTGTQFNIEGATASGTLASPVTRGQAVRVSYSWPGVGGSPFRDLSGNDAVAFSNQTVTNKTRPVFSSAAVNGSTLTITFDGPLDTAAVSKPAGTDFAVTVNGSAADLAATDPVAVSDTTVTLALAEAVLRVDTLTVGYTPGTNRLKDADHAMEEVPGFSGRAVTNDTPADTTKPEFASAAINRAALTVTFNEPLDESVRPVVGVMAVTVDGNSRLFTGTQFNIEGATASGTLASPVTRGQAVRVSYSWPGVGGSPFRDLSGNDAVAFSNQTVTNKTRPVFSSAAVNGSTLTITFDGPLDTAAVSKPAGTDFAVTVNGSAADLAATDPVAVSDTTVTLALAEAVLRVDTLTVGYTPGTNRLKDADHAMEEVPGFSGRAVTNDTPADTTKPEFASAAINRAALTVTFNEPLDESVRPFVGVMAVTVDGNSRLFTSTQFNIEGATASGTLASPVTPRPGGAGELQLAGGRGKPVPGPFRQRRGGVQQSDRDQQDPAGLLLGGGERG